MLSLLDEDRASDQHEGSDQLPGKVTARDQERNRLSDSAQDKEHEAYAERPSGPHQHQADRQGSHGGYPSNGTRVLELRAANSLRSPFPLRAAGTILNTPK
jgi:hypothetical protein